MLIALEQIHSAVMLTGIESETSMNSTIHCNISKKWRYTIYFRRKVFKLRTVFFGGGITNQIGERTQKCLNPLPNYK